MTAYYKCIFLLQMLSGIWKKYIYGLGKLSFNFILLYIVYELFWISWIA